MPVRHILAKTNVPHQNNVSNFALDGSRRLLDNAIIRPGTRGDFILFLGQSKKNYRQYAQRAHFMNLADRLIDRQVEHSGHGTDFLAHTAARTDEHRIHKVLRSQASFPHQRSKGFAFAQAAKTRYRERHTLILAKGARGSSLKWPCTAAAG